MNERAHSQGPNALTQCLMRTINESGRLHMTPSLVNDMYIMRFCVCAQHATDEDAFIAFNVVQEIADDIIRTRNKVLRMLSINRSVNKSRDSGGDRQASMHVKGRPFWN